MSRVERLKTAMERELNFLLSSAAARGTPQGRLVCKAALAKLYECVNEARALALLDAVNQSFLGIEAHGHLTSEEYAAVLRLRQVREQP